MAIAPPPQQLPDDLRPPLAVDEAIQRRVDADWDDLLRRCEA